METTNRDGFDTHTETSTTGAEDAPSGAAQLLVPGLVILAHPNVERVGEESPLAELAAGATSRLSRRAPSFLPPASDVTPKPLGDSFLSRRPLLLTPGPGAGEITIRRGDSPLAVQIDGDLLETERVLGVEEVKRGVVLMLAGRVALLLHPVPVVPPPEGPSFGLVGHSSAMAKLRREIRAAALLDVPVLLRGETGTGKELVARAVHDARPRRGPYLAVNLGALVPALAASELFGATRGAYTGADRQREGFFRRADGGTLFLDEIGEAPIEVQVMLLRTLETGRVQAVGGVDERQVDVRVVAATDADLESAIGAGRFRSALLHRLAGYEIHVPPLRDRRDDVARLLVHFLDEEADALGSVPGRAASGAPGRDSGRAAWPSAPMVARLVSHEWPGNVRELKNVARRLAVLRHVEGMVDPGPLLDQLLRPTAEALVGSSPAGSSSGKSSSGGSSSGGSGLGGSAMVKDYPGEPPTRAGGRARRRWGADVESQELLDVLGRHEWRPGPSAAALGISRPALYRLISEHPDLRTASEIGEDELREVLERIGSVTAAARELKVSPQGLRRRLTALGLDSGSD